MLELTGFSPAFGPAGSEITVSGAAFGTVLSATIGGADAEFTVVSDTEMILTNPDPGANGEICLQDDFHEACSLTAFNGVEPWFIPEPSVAHPGTPVVLQGDGFTTATLLKFGSIATPFTITDDREILTAVPAEATAGPLCLTNAIGTTCQPFGIGGLPAIDSFSPAGGAPGTTLVTIRGSNLAQVVKVTFEASGFMVHRMPASEVTVVSDSEVVARVPAVTYATPITGKIGVQKGLEEVRSSQDFYICGADALTAPRAVCAGATATASVPPGGSAYRWSVTGGSIVTGQDTSSITWTLDSAPAQLSCTYVDACGIERTLAKTVQQAAAATPQLHVGAAVCAGGQGTAFVEPQEGAAYEWTLQNATVVEEMEDGIVFEAGESGEVSITVTANVCGDSRTASGVVPIGAPPAPVIRTVEAICAGALEMAEVVTADGLPFEGATIQWSVTNGSIADEADNWILFEADGGGDVTIGAEIEVCGVPRNANTAVVLSFPPQLVAPSSVVPGGTANASVSAAPGAAFQWHVTGATLLTPADQAAITFTAGTSGNVELSVDVEWCGNTTPLVATVPIGSAPANTAPSLALIGPRTVTAGSPLNIALSATDAEDDQLTFSAEGLPDGASLDPLSGTFGWTPSADDAGSRQVVFRVSDGTLEDDETVVITVVIPGLELMTRTASFEIYNQGRASALPSTTRAVLSDHGNLAQHELGSGRDVELSVTLVSPPPCEGPGCTPALAPGERVRYTTSLESPQGGFGRHEKGSEPGNAAVENPDGTFTLTGTSGSSSSVAFLYGRYLWIEADSARDQQGAKIDEARQIAPELLANDRRSLLVPGDAPAFGQLTHLSATFESEAGGSGDGSPRLDVHLAGHGRISVYLGDPPSFSGTDTAIERYSWFNVVGDAGRRFDTTGLTDVPDELRAAALTWEEARNAAASFTIERIEFVVGPCGDVPLRRFRLRHINVGSDPGGAAALRRQEQEQER